MANNCNRYDPKLALMANGDLRGFARRRVERHVVRCPRCREELQAYRELHGGLTELRREPAGTTRDALRLDVPSILAAARTAPSALAWRPMTTAAALLIACLALIPFQGDLSRGNTDHAAAQDVEPMPGRAQAQAPPVERSFTRPPSDVSEIRFTTSDPNVVIIMLFDEEEESTHEPTA